MKPILTMSLLIVLASSAPARPIAGDFKVVIDEDVTYYAGPNTKTRDFNDFVDDISQVKKVADVTDGVTEFYLLFYVEGNMELNEILRLKKILTPLGFDHFTIISPSVRRHYSIMSSTIILATIGKPTDNALGSASLQSPLWMGLDTSKNPVKK